MDPDSDHNWIRIRDLDPDPGVQNDPEKCWMFFLNAEGFFFNLDIVYGGLGIRKL